MVYEKRMMKPPENWNISGNILIYKEENNSNKIFLVKLFLDSEPVLFEFELPEGLSSDKNYSSYDVEQDNYMIPSEESQSLPDFSGFNNRSKGLNFNRMKQSFGYMRSKTSYFGYESKKDDFKHM